MIVQQIPLINTIKVYETHIPSHWVNAEVRSRAGAVSVCADHLRGGRRHCGSMRAVEARWLAATTTTKRPIHGRPPARGDSGSTKPPSDSYPGRAVAASIKRLRCQHGAAGAPLTQTCSPQRQQAARGENRVKRPRSKAKSAASAW